MFKSFQVLICALVALSAANVVAAALDFTGSQWIWVPDGRGANGAYPVDNVTLRRDYYPPAGKIPLSANILITADDGYTLNVNGYKVGTSNDYTTAQRYCVRLVPDCNVFAVSAYNVGGAAGLLAAIQIRYTDGFTQTIVTDGEWHATIGVPANFEQVAFDDSAWPMAYVQGPYPTASPWGAVTIPAATQDTGPNLRNSSWIWTNEVVRGVAPVGARAFRKTISVPNQAPVDSMVMDIVVDDQYTVYVNGLLVGSGRIWNAAQRYEVYFPPTTEVVIAVYAANLYGPAGLLVSAELKSCDCGCGNNLFVITDDTWKYSTQVPTGFQDPGFNDSAWPQAIVQGPYTISPAALPASNSPQSAALSGAPSAPPASVVV